MFRKQHGVFALLVAFGLAAAPACASQRGVYGSQRDYRDFERRAYDNGYREGLVRGERDARDRRDFRVDRDSDYRNADGGYRGYGDPNDYRRIFRDGYRVGYTEGYNRFARSDRGRFDRSYGGFSRPAAQIGYRDGYEAGRDDARDRDRYDPRGDKKYREGDHDYDRRYGSRDEYKREYRIAFEQGYEQGYREVRR